MHSMLGNSIACIYHGNCMELVEGPSTSVTTLILLPSTRTKRDERNWENESRYICFHGNVLWVYRSWMQITYSRYPLYYNPAIVPSTHLNAPFRCKIQIRWQPSLDIHGDSHRLHSDKKILRRDKFLLFLFLWDRFRDYNCQWQRKKIFPRDGSTFISNCNSFVFFNKVLFIYITIFYF